MSDASQLLRSRWVARSEVPERTRAIGVEDLDGPLQAVATSVLGSFVGASGDGRGLLLYGEVGVGKTTAAAVILREAMLRAPCAWLGCPTGDQVTEASPLAPRRAGFYIPFYRLVRRHHQAFSGDEQAQELLTSLSCDGPVWDRVKLLALDDVGKEYDSGSGFTGSTLHALLRDRFDQGCPTLITTNLNPSAWRTYYGSAMYSFIHQAYEHFEVTGADRRTLAS